MEKTKENRVIMNMFKMFEKREYAEEFLKGSLFCNSFSYFAKLDSDDCKRYDKFEGHSYIAHPDTSEIEMKIGEETFKLDEKSGFIGMRLKLDKDSTKKMFCLYSFIREDYFSRENFRISSKMLSMGGYVVRINDSEEFVNRVDKALNSKRVSYERNLVRYRDLEGYSGRWDCFTKPKEYSYQSEYRIIFEGDSVDAERLEIGDISDIAKLESVDEFLDTNVTIKDKREEGIFDKFTLRELII